MEPTMPNDDVETLAQEMIKLFPTDAANQAVLRSSQFSAMGYFEKSKKWLMVRTKIKKILADHGKETVRVPLRLVQTSHNS